MRGAALALLALALPAGAEPLATLFTHNGTLPPPHHRNMLVTIAPDGAVTLRACRGYATDDASCTTLTGRALAGGVEGIAAAVSAAGLAERPAPEDPMPPVGGGATGASLVLDGQAISLPAFPLAADRARVGAVIAAIFSAVPPDLLAAGGAVLHE